MKRALFGFLMYSLVVHGAESYHVFTDTQGRELKAKIVSFNASKGNIGLEREDGKTFKVSPNLFSEADQDYINKWIAAGRVLSDDNLRVSFKKKSEPADEKATSQTTGFDGEAVHYEVTMENRSGEPIENLEIEYRYFITVAYKAKGREDVVRSVCGKKTLARIDAMSSMTFATDAATYGERIKQVAVYVSQRFTGYDEATISDEDLEGIWLKISGPELDGEPVVRDVFYPAGLEKKVVWGEALSPRMERAFQRGVAVSTTELQTWLVEDLRELDKATEEAQMREISKVIDMYYDEQVDGSGYCGIIIAMGFYRKGLYDLAVYWMEKNQLVQEGAATYTRDLLLSELYATASSVANGARALELANRARDTQGGNPGAWLWSVLAKAYARSGRFDQAVECQTKAIEKLSKTYQERYQAFFERCLECYRSGRPYDLDPADPCCWIYRIRLTSKALQEQEKTQRANGEPVTHVYLWPDQQPEEGGNTRYLSQMSVSLFVE